MLVNRNVFLAVVLLTVTSSGAMADGACGKPSPIAATHTLPPYPDLAEAALQQGATTLRVAVGLDGAPSDVSVLATSGSQQLDETARDYVKANWRWAPAGCSAETKVAISWQIQPDTALDNAPAFAIHPKVVMLQMTRNDYPAAALARKAQGVDGLTMALSPEGAVTRVELTSGSGSPDLDARAVELAKTRYHWAPLTVDGKTLPTLYYVKMQWTLDDAPRAN